MRKMDIQEILKELINKEIIQPNIIEYKQLNGGTTSHLFILGSSENARYVVKLNEPQVIKSEAYFLDFYKDENLLPTLLYVDPSFHFLVYSFISGSSNYVRKNKKEILRTLVQHLINHYRTVPQSRGWGWAEERTDSWQGFLFNRVMEAKKF
jgi:predicted Ser/Thr protein kinase